MVQETTRAFAEREVKPVAQRMDRDSDLSFGTNSKDWASWG